MTTSKINNTSKLRIPRVAMAVLVLGGAAACDEDEKKPGNTEEQMGDGDGDTSMQGDGDQKPDDDTNSDNDAGGDGDGDDVTTTPDSGTPMGTIDVSEARVAKIAADFCMSAFSCDAEYAAEEFTDQETCIADQTSYFQEYITSYGDKCGDAQLDFYDCFAQVDCETDPEEACEEEFGLMVKECE